MESEILGFHIPEDAIMVGEKGLPAGCSHLVPGDPFVEKRIFRLVQIACKVGEPLGDVVHKYRAAGLGDADHLVEPLLTPQQVLMDLLVILIEGVVLPKIKGRVRKGHVNCGIRDGSHHLNGITLNDAVEKAVPTHISTLQSTLCNAVETGWSFVSIHYLADIFSYYGGIIVY
jgi:hypothetical protein